MVESNINAIFNVKIDELCDENENCQNKECELKHPKFMIEICPKFLKGTCEDTNLCSIVYKREHLPWEQLKEQIKDEYSAEDFKKDKKFAFYQKFKELMKETNEYLKGSLTNQQLDLLQLKALKIRKLQNCDLLLILDTTGSMDEWIESVKVTLMKIVDFFKKTFREQKLRIAFVGYKDIDDDGHLDCIDFTENYNDVLKLIEEQKASGGGDAPEDVIGALNKALSLSFDQDQSCCVIHIGDAPSHGKQYQNEELDDQHPDVPLETLEKIMKQFSTKSKQISFVSIKLTDYCDLMYERMREGFPSLIVTESKNPADFLKISINTILSTIQSCTYLKEEDKLTKNFQPDESLMMKIIKAKRISCGIEKLPDDPKILTAEYWGKFDQKITLSEKNVRLKIEKQQYKLGQENWVLFADDGDQRVALKIPKKIPIEQGNEFDNQELETNRKVIQAAIAYQMARYFRKLTTTNLYSPTIYYLKPIMYVLDEPILGLKYIYAELEIADLDKEKVEFQKYTNNLSFAIDKLLASFSHFTYAASCGQFMICDLQGKGNILSDPAFHSTNFKIFKSSTNHAEEGIAAFFISQHKLCCVEVCRALGLFRPEWIHSNSSRKIQWAYAAKNKNIVPSEDHEVKMLCERCNSIVDMKFKEFKTFYNDKDDDTICQSCMKIKGTIPYTQQCLTRSGEIGNDDNNETIIDYGEEEYSPQDQYP